jgi:hypothetical protein
MTRLSLAIAALAVIAFATAAPAQDPAAVYQQQPKQSFRFAGDTLARYEWTKDIPIVAPPPGGGDPVHGLVDESRYRLQLRPRIEANIGPVELGVGGEFNYSEDENDVPPEGQSLTLIRDNYRSRDARLDLAYAKVKLGPLTAQGGRFFMPIPFTEMIWDRDLRPQGGAASLTLGEAQSPARIGFHGIYATGSHVFDDEGDFAGSEALEGGATEMFGGAAELSLGRTGESVLSVMGAYLEFDELNKLEPPIRRQNTRAAGLIVGKYHVFDIVGRLTRGGQVPMQLVFDYCWNTEIEQNNKGLWFAAVLGAIGVSPARLEYTYAKVDKDATLAAYNSDDFFWGTGWEGHRGDIGVSTRKNNSLHAIAQWQRFKDSPDPLVREQWVKRWRLEWRTQF